MKSSWYLLLIVLLISVQWISAEEDSRMFKVGVEILPEYKVIAVGQRVITFVTIENQESNKELVDIMLKLSVVNASGKVVFESEGETFAVGANVSTVKGLNLDRRMNPGKYDLVASVGYRGEEFKGSSSFEVLKIDYSFNQLERSAISSQEFKWAVTLILLFLAGAAFFIYKKLQKIEKITPAREKRLVSILEALEEIKQLESLHQQGLVSDKKYKLSYARLMRKAELVKED